VTVRQALRLAIVLGCAVLAVSLVRMPLRVDVSGATDLQINGGSVRVLPSNNDRLKAWVPLASVPFVMARQTDELLEVGGLEGSDIRVLLMGRVPFGHLPASIGNVDWELLTDDLERVTVTGGVLYVDGYEQPELSVSALGGHAELRDVDVENLTLVAEGGGTVRAAGRSVRLRISENGGRIEYGALDYRVRERQLIETGR
jgi:hypothetical protein